ncbi:CHAT domain-containing protein [Candidatus Viridilinea mediisalina]|uniref:CHAT domain-containing protein n=1 Tax=Candidatus Viridilinea mediisalina TaxID=2024553 RepID=A0A2A6RGT7_9CHLR|nr:CHAT domain-containing protein [Candidatus Viridilinea mediisalina]PDW02099.1 hypothetical protein CJ255_15740 [Candidatus Viridilinea mediisalina]
MASDLQKTVAGALLFGASALTGNALLMNSAGGVAVNWAAEGVGGLWSTFARRSAGATPLAEAGRRAIRRAVEELKVDYRTRYGCQVDTRAFDLVRDCAAAVATIDPSETPADAVGAQQALAGALGGLLHGHDERQRALLEKDLLPRVARTFRDELIGDDAARSEYHALVLASLAGRLAALQPQLAHLPAIYNQLRDAERFSYALADSLDTLKVQVAELRAALARLEQGAGESVASALYLGSAVAEEGGRAATKNVQPDGPVFPPALPPAQIIAINSAIARGSDSHATATNRYGAACAPELSGELGRSPALLLTLQFTPTPTGTQVRWQADELGGYTSHFVAPYCGHMLAAVLRALEHQQHPAFTLDYHDRENLHAIGLLDDPMCLPADLPRRVGQALYAALVREQGMVALTLAQSQARQHVQRTPDDLAVTQAHLDQLWHALETQGNVVITRLSPVRRDDLIRAMGMQPDIVYYTGHGWYAEGRGVLMLDPSTPTASADLVDADQIAVALRGARMVLLAACRSAQGPGIESGRTSLLTGVAPALSAAGVPLVVGMQLGVTVAAIQCAAQAIYCALAEGHSVQAAVSRARDALYIAEPERHSWYVPVLYVRTREAGPVFL